MPAVLAFFNEAIVSCFSPPRLAGTPGSHKKSELETIKVQSGPPDVTAAQLEVERNGTQDNRCDV